MTNGTPFLHLPGAIAALIAELAAMGHLTYFCCDTVRNWLVGERASAFAVLTSADLVELARLHESMSFPGRPGYQAELELEGATVRFRCFAGRPESPTWDFLRRLTEREILKLDTFLYEPSRELFHDPWAARGDLIEKRIDLMPGADLTSPYALFKVLDALFLQSHLGYRLAPDAALSLERLAPSIDLELMEEIRPRLDRLFTSRDSHAAVTGLDRLHLLTALFPELVPAQELRQDKDFHPEGTVYEHTLECFRFIESPSLHLFLALLLHDVGKPSTATLDKNLRYPGHSRAGVALARRMLRRLGYDEPLIEKVAFLIRYHLVAHEMRRMSAPRQRELMEDELFPDLLRLYKADIRSCYGDLEQYYRVLAMAKEVRRD